MKSSTHQFKQLILNFNDLFKKDKIFYFFRINWFQILRYHPQIFLRYEILYKSKLDFYFEFSTRLLKYLLLISKHILKSIFIFENNFYKNLPNVDCVLVSHFLSKNNLGSSEDFHFRHLHDVLLEKNCSVNIFLHNHTKISTKIIENSWNNSLVPRYVAPNNTNLKNEINILMGGIKVFLYYILKKINKKNIINRINTIAGLEAISNSSLSAERFSRSLQRFVISVNPKYIIFTFEGHSWERLLIHKIRALNKNIICIGFVHTTLFPHQHASLVSCSKEFMPDHIFVPGKEIAKIFQKQMFKSTSIKVIGSPKKKNQNFIFKTRQNLRVLILPEGFEPETLKLINFGIDLAKKCTYINFRIRIHPELFRKENTYNQLIMEKNLSNIKLSKETFFNDINWSSHAIYRGSTSILEAISFGVLPLYYGKKSELTIDPMFLLKSKDHWVKDTTETIKKFNLWKDMTATQKFKQIKSYVNFCNNLIKPLDTKTLNKLIK